jgi:ATP-dependent exoDNAse (exonuclease V) alpha subunit
LVQTIYRYQRSARSRRCNEPIDRVGDITEKPPADKPAPERFRPRVVDPNSPAAHASIIVIDEASMVDERRAADLLSFGKKLLVLGDPAQLPPIRGRGVLLAGEPDAFLTEVHRQALGDPIIGLSMMAREGRSIACGHYGDNVVMNADLDLIHLLGDQADQVLCGTNKTRLRLNRQMRQFYGRRGWLPERGDRIVCLENRHERGLANGTLWTVVSSWKGRLRESGIEVLVMTIAAEDGGEEVEVVAPALGFAGRHREVPDDLQDGLDPFDFGYALTTHKAQGSEWDEVAVVDESVWFREHRHRHLYTAITRAARRLTIVRAQ